jgi:hypothetical protein
MPPDPAPPPSPDAPLLTSHEWVRWLAGVDATVLLLHLCQAIDDPAVSHEALLALVHGWRKNALQALVADDWTASVDDYLEVKVDARLYYFTQGLDRRPPRPRPLKPLPQETPETLLREALRDATEAAGYLLTVLETYDLATIRRAVRDLADLYREEEMPPRSDPAPEETPHA